MEKEIAISIKRVSKDFKLPHEKQKSLKGLALNSFSKKSYEVQHALKDISFDVYKGEFFGIVGRNGSGKSTLLKCIAGVYTPSRGSIEINGSLVPFIELGVGFNPALTGRDNVFLNGALLGFSRKEMEEMYDEIVQFAELEKFMDQKLSNYSSGMQVRLAFSIAIRAQSDILLLDEVLAVGDSSFQRKCLDYFRHVKKLERTVILVTHSMATIEEFCDRALMLEDSRIVAIGHPLQISAEYEIANSVFVEPKSRKLTDKGDKKDKTDKKEETKQEVKDEKEIKDEKKLRPRNPDVEIKHVTVGSGKEVTTDFGLEDDVYVRVELEVRKKQAILFSLVLHNMDGEYVAGVNSKNLPKLIPPTRNFKIACKIKAGQFPNGPYRLTVNVMRDSEGEELIDVASHEFGVELPIITFIEKSLYKKGKFYMDAEWQLKDS